MVAQNCAIRIRCSDHLWPIQSWCRSLIWMGFCYHFGTTAAQKTQLPVPGKLQLWCPWYPGWIQVVQFSSVHLVHTGGVTTVWVTTPTEARTALISEFLLCKKTYQQYCNTLLHGLLIHELDMAHVCTCQAHGSRIRWLAALGRQRVGTHRTLAPLWLWSYILGTDSIWC